MPRKSKLKSKYRQSDIDQIFENKKPENVAKYLQEATKVDEDKPALGQHYCLPCDKYFCSAGALEVHNKQKPHKRRLKILYIALFDVCNIIIDITEPSISLTTQ
ncbi:unnamed protein product [Mesocestoides corti]|uniref:C2H2-type domain-containing protein n=1 Tax=Mesocestoides corti TaxID=53468 RepID=A0A0R3URR7_MESCO|nr:unnamed protein product [Mesocestoides corti]